MISAGLLSIQYSLPKCSSTLYFISLKKHRNTFFESSFKYSSFFINIDAMSWQVELPSEVSNGELYGMWTFSIALSIYSSRLNAPSDRSSAGISNLYIFTSTWIFGLPRALSVLGFMRSPGASMIITVFTFPLCFCLTWVKSAG